jgi:hypothetical protein
MGEIARASYLKESAEICRLSKRRSASMERHVILMFVITTSLCGCSRESKAPDQPLASPPAGTAAARPLADEPSVTPPEKSAAARPVADDPASDADDKKSGLGDYVSFPAFGLKIRQPEGFEKADNFDGFGEPETQSSIMVLSIPAAYSQVTAGMTREQLKKRGWSLESRDDVKVNGLPGILVHFEQPAGDEVFLKWSFIFGDDQKTTMVTATCPKVQARQLSDRLKSAVLSLRPDQATSPVPGADLPFTLAASEKLKISPGISRTLAYTKDGVFMIKSPDDPLFIATSSLGEVIVGDRRKFAEQRVLGTVHTKQMKVKSIDTITIDGLDGFESLAEAEEDLSGTPLIVYQVILFDEGSYILMQGHVGTKLRDDFLPEFKAIARSLRRK